MRAVVIATGQGTGQGSLGERCPAPLLPLVDRPFIQHVVEFLVHEGTASFDLVLSLMPEKIEELLGDGKRWGCSFKYHLSRWPERPYGILKVLQANEEENEPTLLVHGDRLPRIQVGPLAAGAKRGQTTLIYRAGISTNIRDMSDWTGWAMAPFSMLKDIPAELDEKDLGRHLLEQSEEDGAALEAAPVLGARSYAELLEAQNQVLSRTFSMPQLSGREIENGIWLSKNVHLAPTARLIPPVHVGENCRIGQGVGIGPNAVVGRDCVLDKRCTVSNSLVFTGSYVGEALEVDHALVDRNCLVSVKIGAELTISDDFILSSVSRRAFRGMLAGGLSHLGVLLLLVVFSPLLIALAGGLKLLRRGPVFFSDEKVRLPAESTEAAWRTFNQLSLKDAREGAVTNRKEPWSLQGHFLFLFLPGLLNAVRGHLRLVGVSTRTPDDIRSLPRDWRALYLRAKAGLVTEALIVHGLSPDDDELYSAEAYYSVSASPLHDFRLLTRYFARLLRPAGGRGVATGAGNREEGLGKT